MYKNILVLEDNVHTAQVIQKIISNMDIKVKIECFAKVEEAYKYALEHAVDVFVVDIILDTTIPGDTSGIIFAQKIREIRKYYFTPLIFITALSDPELYLYRNLQCFGYIEKPFVKEQIIKLLDKALFYKTEREENHVICFRKDGIIYPIKECEIILAQVCNHHMSLVTNTEEIEIPYKTIKAFLNEVVSEDLIQCNRYTVINKSRIEKIDFGNRYIHLRGYVHSVEIGITYKKEIQELLYGRDGN